MRAFVRTQLILLLGTLVLLEIALQIACVFSLDLRRLVGPPWQPIMIPDESLVLRGNPLHRDADAAGYRNSSRLAHAEVVVLGDSQTYGPELRSDAWPQVLGGLQRRSVYNMALPGYGPLQSYLQLDDAMGLKPKLVIVAPYFGNDFFDTFVLHQRRSPEFDDWVAPHLLQQARQAEQARPIEAEVTQMFRFAEAPAAADSSSSSLRRWASDNIKLYGFLRALKDRILPPPATPLLSRKLEIAAQGLTPEMKRHASVFDGSGWRTILTAPYRDRVVDDTDPRIRVGFEVARVAVQKVAQRCKSAGVELLVVLIPTKELVFFPHISNQAEHLRLEGLVANERRLRAEWIAELEAHGIRYVDTLPVLTGAPVQPYPEDLDGHPTASGHRIIAGEVARRLGGLTGFTAPAQ